MEAAAFYPKVRGTFGCNEEKEWACSIGQNTKGGMDDAEFEKYLCNSIFPLYPDARDRKGFRVLLKVDSGPG